MNIENFLRDANYSYRAHMKTSAEYACFDRLTNTYLISDRDIWKRAPKAAARKATAPGVNGLCIDNTDGKFFIFQISGYTLDRGLFCDLLDESGRVIGSY